MYKDKIVRERPVRVALFKAANSSNIRPGMAIIANSVAGEVRTPVAANSLGFLMALEKPMGSVTDTYADGEQVRAGGVVRGDRVNVLLATNNTQVSVGSIMGIDAGGRWDVTGSAANAVGSALEAVAANNGGLVEIIITR